MHLRYGLPKNVLAVALATFRGGEQEPTIEILIYRSAAAIPFAVDERLHHEGNHEGFGGELAVWSSWRGSGCGIVLTKTENPAQRFQSEDKKKRKPEFLFLGDKIRYTEQGFSSLIGYYCGFIHPTRGVSEVILVIWSENAPTPSFTEDELGDTISFFRHLAGVLSTA